MKKYKVLCFAFAFLFKVSIAQQICNPNGNLVVLSNYDGGHLNIVIDANIPNLKIGVVSYEAVSINISGPFAANVTGVIYAGYNANNNHCTPSVPTTSISGVAASIVNLQTNPPANIPDPNGYGLIICAYNCTSTGSAGGCNTANQITGYFLNAFPGAVLYAHRTQYACWSGNFNIANGGNCCIAPVIPVPPIAAIHASSTQICPGDCIQFTDSSLHNPTTWVWNFTGGIPSLFNGQYPGTICFPNRGSFQASLSVSNAHGTSNQSIAISVQGPDTTVTISGLTLTSQAGNTGTTYQWVDCSDGWNPIAGATSQSYTVLQNGSYAVILHEGGCIDTSRCLAVNNVGLENNHMSMTFRIFPNPASEWVEITTPFGLERTSAKIYTSEGKLILGLSNLYLGQKISVRELPNGIYTMQLLKGDTTCSQTFIIRR
jgi:PKD repeat protein